VPGDCESWIAVDARWSYLWRPSARRTAAHYVAAPFIAVEDVSHSHCGEPKVSVVFLEQSQLELVADKRALCQSESLAP